MGYGIINESTLYNIADALRAKTGSNVNFLPSSMAEAIENISTGESFPKPSDPPKVANISWNNIYSSLIYSSNNSNRITSAIRLNTNDVNYITPTTINTLTYVAENSDGIKYPFNFSQGFFSGGSWSGNKILFYRTPAELIDICYYNENTLPPSGLCEYVRNLCNHPSYSAPRELPYDMKVLNDKPYPYMQVKNAYFNLYYVTNRQIEEIDIDGNNFSLFEYGLSGRPYLSNYTRNIKISNYNWGTDSFVSGGYCYNLTNVKLDNCEGNLSTLVNANANAYPGYYNYDIYNGANDTNTSNNKFFEYLDTFEFKDCNFYFSGYLFNYTFNQSTSRYGKVFYNNTDDYVNMWKYPKNIVFTNCNLSGSGVLRLYSNVFYTNNPIIPIDLKFIDCNISSYGNQYFYYLPNVKISSENFFNSRFTSYFPKFDNVHVCKLDLTDCKYPSPNYLSGENMFTSSKIDNIVNMSIDLNVVNYAPYMFSEFETNYLNLKSLNLNFSNFANVYSFRSMFYNIKANHLDASGINFAQFKYNNDIQIGGLYNCNHIDLSNSVYPNIQVKYSNYYDVFSPTRVYNQSYADRCNPWCKTINVTNMDISLCKEINGMFMHQTNLTDIYGLETLDLSNITNIGSMFYHCDNLVNINVSNWDTSNITGFYGIFSYCSNLTNIDVSNWDTSNVTQMGNVFGGCSNLSGIMGLTNWNTSKVTAMYFMFSSTNLNEINLSSWDVSNVYNVSAMFSGCKNLNKVDLSGWVIKSPIISYMFNGCTNLNDINMFNMEMSTTYNAGYMFNNCQNIKVLDLSNWDFSKLNYAWDMFNNCRNLTTIYYNPQNFNLDSMPNIYVGSNAFRNCVNLVGPGGSYSSSYVNLDATTAARYFTPKP